MASPKVQSPTGPAQKQKLSRELVLTKALEVVDAEGLEALTMRRLGQELGRDPMSLYRYAENRAALLDGVTELVLNELTIHPDDPDWKAQLRRIAHDLRSLALQHPNVVPLLVTRPLSTPLGLRPLGTLRPLEQILSLLIGAGFSPSDALHVYRAYYGFLYGHILNELQEFVVDPEENEVLLRLGLHRLPAKEFPRLRALAPALADYEGSAELDQGLSILLSGLEAQLSLQDAEPTG
ncbi:MULTISPECIES: TetR/AcrR family transcriptional regulator C-terminal domain-containing protein [Pseudarthrobacter]|jgi:AcrR family transcriptional regulator|uniref:TetR/AcrR family transcriptional regulator C-terminal domain-containing protein n=1 Tax=Pseudarthrobacter TaxID=1742993 RepID=UPI0012F88417|nr:MULTISPECIES: TetR/AcrR family transcriptional regulator C-terminal domain-containing protein [Pseudarthrobacter]MEA3551458.1 TetR/AcrR family transcriptional regulator C-terminal domain-containing protein [Pseudarthrobacter sp. C1]MUU71818.1 TetR family transcriptional regulator [Pseudarthrobacter sp. GA104]WPU09169.1 TetR/AcrR family transcriptional regulator C-terminal domain-containing protein [Pseudarthrobacter oxydans]HET7781616.1 TetR/AcrR family transcriptional regulator C-terminal d